MIVLRRVHEPRVTAAAAVIVRHQLLAAAAREHQVRIEIIGLEVHGERLIRPDRQDPALEVGGIASELGILGDRKSTRLNSSHLVISYAVFCLKKKKKEAAGMRKGAELSKHRPRMYD